MPTPVEKGPEPQELEAFKALFPTANLTPEARETLENYLPSWLEMLTRFKEQPWAHAALVGFAQKAVLNVDIYNGLSDDDLTSHPLGDEEQDTPLQEWSHQIRNLLSRGNTLQGKKGKEIYELGLMADNINNFAQLDRTGRSILHLTAVDHLLTSATVVDTISQQLIHQPGDKFDWWGEKTFAQIMITGLMHECDHSHYTHYLYFQRHRGFPPIQAKMFGSPLQTR